MRAVILLFWPDPPRSTKITERAALVLTGDSTLLKSGPVARQALSEHSLPGYDNCDRIVHIPMPKAVEFLIQPDKRAVAANPALQARNGHYAAQNRAECLLEARERVRLAKEGRIGKKAKSYVEFERRVEE